MNTKSLTRIAIMTSLTIAGAYISIPIPNLPFTMQTFFSILAGLLLIRRDAVISQLLYLTIGLLGLPVFAGGGGGIAYIFYPSFGYIIFLPILTYLVSSFKSKNVYLATFIPLVFMLIFGGIWLIVITRLYMSKSIGSLIFSIILLYIPVELVKGVLGIILWKRLKNILIY